MTTIQESLESLNHKSVICLVHFTDKDEEVKFEVNFSVCVYCGAVF